MYLVVFSSGLEYARFADREDAEMQVSILRAAGRTSARVERVS